MKSKLYWNGRTKAWANNAKQATIYTSQNTAFRTLKSNGYFKPVDKYHSGEYNSFLNFFPYARVFTVEIEINIKDVL